MMNIKIKQTRWNLSYFSYLNANFSSIHPLPKNQFKKCTITKNNIIAGNYITNG